MTYRELYPAIEPYQVDRLRVGALHELYIEQCGNPNGAPVVFLHGGPGGGCNSAQRRFFDPARYRIILFDQRGAGRSTPLGETAENSTGLLIDDIEAIREMLGIERWHVFGGSWGATLAIAYAQAHPDRCLSLTLRGIFLLRQWDIDWFLHGMGTVFPEAWRNFAGFIPEAERHDLMAAYTKRLYDHDPAIRLAAARSWSCYEGACSSLVPSADLVGGMEDETVAIGIARLEAHYMTHHLYDPAGAHDLVRNVYKIRHIPAVIVQGRYDMVCPIRNADELHVAWPEADYIVIPDAGHSASEPGIRSALLEAAGRFAGMA